MAVLLDIRKILKINYNYLIIKLLNKLPDLIAYISGESGYSY
jgi:hypothetical protein